MLFQLASLIRHYTNLFTLWVLNTAFAIDRLSEELLGYAQRHYWRPLVQVTFKRTKKGAVMLRFKNLEK